MTRRQEVIKKTNGLCKMCNVTLQVEDHTKKNFFTIDHLISRRNGGSNDINNLFPLCLKCNSIKGSKDCIEIGIDMIGHADKLNFSRFINVYKYESKCKAVDEEVIREIKDRLINILKEKIEELS